MKNYTCHAYTTNEALTTAREIVDIASGRRLHATILLALAGITSTRETLDALSTSREQEDDPLGADVRGPMFALRSTLARFADALRGHAELPVEDELVTRARRAYAAIFPDGTAFLKGTAVDVDVRGGRVLDRARQKRNAAVLAELGFASVVKLAAKELAQLRAALGANARVVEEEQGIEVLTALAAATAALREYARAVQAVDRVQGTRLGRELLTPFVNRRAPKPRKVVAPTPAAPTRAAANDTMEDKAPPSRAA